MASQQDFGKNIPEMFGGLPELMTGGITNPQDWLSLLYTGNLATPPAVPQMPVTPQNYDQELRNTRDPDMAADSAFNRAISQVGGDLEQNMIDILASSQGKARTAAELLPTTPMERDHPATQELIKALGTEFGVSPDAIKKEQPQQAPVIDEFSAWDPNGLPVSGIPGTNFTGKTIDEVLAGLEPQEQDNLAKFLDTGPTGAEELIYEMQQERETGTIPPGQLTPIPSDQLTSIPDTRTTQVPSTTAQVPATTTQAPATPTETADFRKDLDPSIKGKEPPRTQAGLAKSTEDQTGHKVGTIANNLLSFATMFQSPIEFPYTSLNKDLHTTDWFKETIKKFLIDAYNTGVFDEPEDNFTANIKTEIAEFTPAGGRYGEARRARVPESTRIRLHEEGIGLWVDKLVSSWGDNRRGPWEGFEERAKITEMGQGGEELDAGTGTAGLPTGGRELTEKEKAAAAAYAAEAARLAAAKRGETGSGVPGSPEEQAAIAAAAAAATQGGPTIDPLGRYAYLTDQFAQDSTEERAASIWSALRQEELGKKAFNPYLWGARMSGFEPAWERYLASEYGPKSQGFLSFLRQPTSPINREELRRNLMEASGLAGGPGFAVGQPQVGSGDFPGGMPLGPIQQSRAYNLAELLGPNAPDQRANTIALIAASMGAGTGWGGATLRRRLGREFDLYRSAAEAGAPGYAPGGFAAWQQRRMSGIR